MKRVPINLELDFEDKTEVEDLRYTLNYQASSIHKELVDRINTEKESTLRIDLLNYGSHVIDADLAKYLLDLLTILSSLLSRVDVTRECSSDSIALPVPKLINKVKRNRLV